jgi:hypothetical protein
VSVCQPAYLRVAERQTDRHRYIDRSINQSQSISLSVCVRAACLSVYVSLCVYVRVSVYLCVCACVYVEIVLIRLLPQTLCHTSLGFASSWCWFSLTLRRDSSSVMVVWWWWWWWWWWWSVVVVGQWWWWSRLLTRGSHNTTQKMYHSCIIYKQTDLPARGCERFFIGIMSSLSKYHQVGRIGGRVQSSLGGGSLVAKCIPLSIYSWCICIQCLTYSSLHLTLLYPGIYLFGVFQMYWSVRDENACNTHIILTSAYILSY